MVYNKHTRLISLNQRRTIQSISAFRLMAGTILLTVLMGVFLSCKNSTSDSSIDISKLTEEQFKINVVPDTIDVTAGVAANRLATVYRTGTEPVYHGVYFDWGIFKPDGTACTKVTINKIDGSISVTDQIAVEDAGVRKIRATGKNNYSGYKEVDLTVNVTAGSN